MQGFLFEQFDQVHVHVAGVDEAGRGPLAGPVFAAAVILDRKHDIPNLMDSKVLSESQRDDIALQIREQATAYSIASASVEEIDRLNILQATMLAMKRACDGLKIRPGHVLVDGNHVPLGLGCPGHAVVRGDATVAAISAASILAKTARDALCNTLHDMYPEYGFARHKGYATRAHLALLEQHGPCPAHRRSFAPVRRLLET